MGIPYRQKGISIISIAVDAPQGHHLRPVGQGGQAAGGQLENSLRRGEKVSALQKLAETLAACHNLEDGELLLLLRDSGPPHPGVPAAAGPGPSPGFLWQPGVHPGVD